MQIASLILANQTDQDPVDTVTLVPTFARKDEAAWHSSSMPEIGRVTCVYTRRPPVKGSDLTKHAFRLTVPTLKSEVTDPSGPYAPVPALDYVTVGEIAVWTHARSTAEERSRVLCMMHGLYNAGGTLGAAMYDTMRDSNQFY